MELNVVKSGTWGTCLWGIDDTGFLLIGEGTGASITRPEDAPWDDIRSIITEIKFVGNVNMPEQSALRGAFKDCTLLSYVDASTFDTYQVVDMGSMFENCTSLKELSLTSMDTRNVKNMNRMFYGCRALTNLDLSSFSTVEVMDMHDMFSRCNKLHNLTLGDRFSTVGNGQTSCGNLAIRDTGRYRMAKVVDVVAGMIFYHYNALKRDDVVAKQSITGFRYTIEENGFVPPRQECKFLEWNTLANGKGTSYQPGDEIENVDDDLNLYAIWVAPPVLGTLEQPTTITYGNKVEFKMPEIYSETDAPITGYLEISPTGRDRTWRQIEHTTILPVAFDGYLMRLVAYNDYGTAYSNPVRLNIVKAQLDLSKLYWTEQKDMSYDGTHKWVWLEGLPEGVKASYEGNSGVEAGEYTATVTLDYDKENFETGLVIRPYTWEIKKAKYDMSTVRWNYTQSYVYDGTEQSVELIGLPNGVTASYQNNTGKDVDIRTAYATFAFDNDNYQKPDDIAPCVWEIKKAYLDANKFQWTDCEDFVYDGYHKKVVIQNLPNDAIVEYYGNEEFQAGKYLARAVLSDNYYTNGPIEFEWSIKKAKHDLSEVRWNYERPFTYNKDSHSVALVNVPSGLNVRYYNHIATDAGDYTAHAEFACTDPHNFETPGDMSIAWTIKKLVLDISDATWNYSVPFVYDGGTKSVELVNLPEEVYAIIENGSASRAGVYIAHANLKYDENNYIVEQPADCQWQINKAKFDISDVHWNYARPFQYDGEEKIINLVNVPEGLSVEYQNNAKINAGKYVATARLTPIDINYEVPIVNGCTWSINKSLLDRIDIVWSDDKDFVYDGTQKSVRIISEVSDNLRIEYSGADSIEAGEYEAVATFFSVDADNFEAPAPVRHRWAIQRSHFDIGGVVWDYTSHFTYDGTRKEVKLVNVPAGLKVIYENNTATEVGEYTAVARFEIMDDNNFYPLDALEIHWSIQKATYDLSQAHWQDTISFSYDGLAKRVELEDLPNGITPNYLNNVASAAGDYIATVEFNYDDHNYEEPVFPECRWRIEKTIFDIGAARWDYEEPFVYDGREKSVRVAFMPDGAKVEYSNERATRAGVYTATANVYAEDSANHMHTQMPNLVWRIEKGIYDMSNAYWDYDKPYTYDGTEKKIILKGLPEGVIPTYSGNIGIEAGVYHASVSFRVVDSDNYNVPTFPDLEWEIAKADCDMTGVEWTYKGAFTYNGRMQEIVLTGLPDGVRASYNGNCETAVGSYTATADFQLYDSANYNVPTFEDCHWEIIKADYDMSQVQWSSVNHMIYNGRKQGVYLENLPNGIYAEYTDNEATEVGRYFADAVLKVADPSSFNIPAVAGCEWIIDKADVDMSEATWNFVPESLVYDGTPKSIRLENLPEFVGVSYTGETAVGAGRYTATAEFMVTSPNYNTPDAIEFNWFINKADCDMSQVKWDYTDEYVYDALPHGIEVSGLPENVTVVYENNRMIDAGNYVAVARFSTDIANYNVPEEMSCQWSIIKANCDTSTVRWDYDQSFVYDGTEKELRLVGVPDHINVQCYGHRGTNAGHYHAVAEFMPADSRNYNIPEPVEFNWEIAKASYDMNQTVWSSQRSFVYNGETKLVLVEGYPEGIRPIYSNNTAVNAGSYYAEVTFDYDFENYEEPRMQGCEWVINKTTYNMTNTYWNYSRPFTYDGEEKSVRLEGLPAGVAAIYTDNVAIGAGEYVAEARFTYDNVNYEEPYFDTCTWTIKKAEIPVDFSVLEWDYADDFVYDGTPQGVALKKVIDNQSFLNKLRGYKPEAHIAGVPAGFEVEYKDNVMTDAGCYYARAILRPIANVNYNSLELPAFRWEIKKAPVDMSRTKWSYTGGIVFDGEEHHVELVNLPEAVTAEYRGNVAFKAGVYEAQVSLTLVDSKNFEAPAPFRGCLWKIDKARIDTSAVVWNCNEFVYDGNEKYVELIGLPDGVKVAEYKGTAATDAGNYTAEAVLTCDDPDNFEAVSVAPLRWKIHKQVIDTSEMTWNYVDSTLFVYDEQIKEVELVGIPDGIDVVYVNNRKINAGRYVAKAKLLYDTKNYIAQDVQDLAWKIEKARFDTSITYWDYDGPFEYDGHEKKVTIRNIPAHLEVRYMDNRATAIGSYTAKAYISYNADNYVEPDIPRTLEWEIVR